MPQANGPKGWHSRGYHPHFDGNHTTQSINFRLAGSVSRELFEKWKAALTLARHLDDDVKKLRMISKLEAQLDLGRGVCHLKNPKIAALVEKALLYFDGERLQLHAWCVMPNHVHVLLTPHTGYSVAKIVKSWKSYTARRANCLLGLKGPFWETDYYDRYIRNPDHFQKARNYIENNPVKAGLCEKPEDWAFGSARFRVGPV